MTTRHDRAPETSRHRPVGAPGAITVTTADEEDRSRPFRGRVRWVGRA
ncbi:hypothetical protein QF037_003715 [Streptomyces canus]|nr:hypothetical protein [Streptomyces canus]MDQ0599370.1 hypothetical protein [Streptomyces canus]